MQQYLVLIFKYIHIKYNQTGVNRDKPGNQIWNYGVSMIQGFTSWTITITQDSFNVIFIIFFLNMVDYPVLPLLLST